MIKIIFTYLSGKPKDGDVVENISILTIIGMLLSIIMLYLGFRTYPQHHIGSIYFGLMTIALAWQAGWGMSIERFNKSEK